MAHWHHTTISSSSSLQLNFEWIPKDTEARSQRLYESQTLKHMISKAQGKEKSRKHKNSKHGIPKSSAIILGRTRALLPVRELWPVMNFLVGYKEFGIMIGVSFRVEQTEFELLFQSSLQLVIFTVHSELGHSLQLQYSSL